MQTESHDDVGIIDQIWQPDYQTVIIFARVSTVRPIIGGRSNSNSKGLWQLCSDIMRHIWHCEVLMLLKNQLQEHKENEYTNKPTIEDNRAENEITQ